MAPPGVRVRVRVTALCGIWSLLPRTASLDAWKVTISDSCLREVTALTPLSNNNNSPSWLLFAQCSYPRSHSVLRSRCEAGGDGEASPGQMQKVTQESEVGSGDLVS